MLLTIREAISMGLKEALNNNDNCFIMGEDIGDYGGAYSITKGFLEEYGKERIIDTPISESAIIGAGCGAALAGMKPIVEIMSINFTLLAMDQIVNNIAKLNYLSNGQMKVPIIIRTVTGGGGQLSSTHSQSLEHWYASVPGLIVVNPSNAYDALGLLRTSIRSEDPILFVEHGMIYRNTSEVPEEYYEIPFGQANTLESGEDITIISYSRMACVSLEVSEILKKEYNLSSDVIDLRTLSPLDSESMIKSVKKTGNVVIIEEAHKTGGFSGELTSIIQEECFDYLDSPIIRICSEDIPIPYSKGLEDIIIPNAQTAIKQIINKLNIKI
tara:strand:+ start:28571 stop:29554 length:984 start_codon:yes stop_codon:yes gene_type:complete